MSVLQPIGQVRLTNVAYVRLAKKGKRFEIACYRNKVLNWRNKIEQDINEVLQVASVFTNVSKGTLASAKDLLDAFGTAEHLKVCEEILEKGDLQVSEKEREAMLESMFRDVASLVCEMTINPENGRQYSLSMIQNAMKQIHFSVNLRSAKKQALDVIRKLKPVMSIVRAGMLVRMVCRPQDVAAADALLEAERQYLTLVKRQVSESAAAGASTAAEGVGDAWFELRIDPEAYRRLEDSVRVISEGFGRVEIMQLRVGSAGGADPLPVSGDTKAEDDETPLVTSLSLTEKEDKKPARATATADERGSDEDTDEIITAKAMSARDKKKDKKKERKKKNMEERQSVVQDPAPSVSEAAASAVAEQPSATTPAHAGTPPDPPEDDAPVGKKCNTCGGSFPSDSEYRLHFRSEWHRYNLKRKMKNLSTVSEAEFSALPAAEIAKTTDH